ncbi:MAG TPA: malic enzyme-like NAD(P)-binding protein, partial [Solirubrobacterales bacterium]
MAVSAQYSVTIRVELDARQEPLGRLTAAIAEAGGQLQGVDLVPGAGPEGKRVREFTIDAADREHWERILRAIGSTRGARVLDYVDRTMQMHRGGKIEQRNKYPLKTRDDLSMAYTPGVARVCMDIHAERGKAFEYTIKKNTVAVVSDGSAVLGLGNIGPEAAMPVMEGKCMLFKEFAGVDAFPICLDTQDADEIVRAVELMAPGFGGINLEDISAPRCFEIEDRLREELDIPVFHDDQHGTAVVMMAALFNALKIVDKPIESLRVVMVGLGAAGIACTKMMLASGVTEIIGCDRQGAVSTERAAEDPGKAEHVVDLVRIIGASRRHDPHVGLGLLGHHLRVRVRHREHDRVLRHRRDVVTRDHVGCGDADEHVGVLERVRDAARDAARVRHGRRPEQGLVQ